jgi:hypothetical protein
MAMIRIKQAPRSQAQGVDDADDQIVAAEGPEHERKDRGADEQCKDHGVDEGGALHDIGGDRKKIPQLAPKPTADGSVECALGLALEVDVLHT